MEEVAFLRPSCTPPDAPALIFCLNNTDMFCSYQKYCLTCLVHLHMLLSLFRRILFCFSTLQIPVYPRLGSDASFSVKIQDCLGTSCTSWVLQIYGIILQCNWVSKSLTLLEGEHLGSETMPYQTYYAPKCPVHNSHSNVPNECDTSNTIYFKILDAVRLQLSKC